MFVDENLRNHLDSSSTVKSSALVVAEWNMNYSDNINLIGNYRYRPLDSNSVYSSIINSFDIQDSGRFYTDATDADVKVDGGFDDDGTPTIFQSNKQKEKMLFSLEDCFSRFRPRSGINKARYFEYSKFLHHSNQEMARRPRYYPPHKDDKFKYWSSYRTEDGIERGIANQPLNNQYYIDDASPFVVYKNPVPANRVVVKMQTNVGDIDLGPFNSSSGSFEDPLYGNQNATTPVTWKIQSLNSSNDWTDIISFGASSQRADGSPIIGPDGYLEIAYGIQVPEKYRDSFTLVAGFPSADLLPPTALFGQAFLIATEEDPSGVYKIWNGASYDDFIASYGWSVLDESVSRSTRFVSSFSSPETYLNTTNGGIEYAEFQYLNGLRIVVSTMNAADATFDLIELSPRLSANISGYVTGFDLSKSASDLGVSGMPVSQLLASTGSLNLFDHDNSFNQNNSLSIISDYVNRNIQIKFYDVVSDVGDYDYFIPIKTMYSDGLPEYSNKDRYVSIALRDLFFYLESVTAPQTLVTGVSLSYAVSLLMDSIGITNYKFFRVDGESEITIPFFFIGPDTNVASVLESLAISSQSAMFFDEYNNFIVMSKNYMMPLESERPTDLVLTGSDEDARLANIIDVGSQESSVYNGGNISYTSRYIQRSYGSIRQASLVDQEKTWIYKPALLWEVAAGENTKSINNETNSQSSYVLSAIPLNSDLIDSVPSVVNHQLVNNIMDMGEAVYWISRYNGYFYANAEVIKYDAVEYSVPGIDGNTNVWISGVQQYQNYFSKLGFNGKIYPTGLVRIYAEPYYEVVDGVSRLVDGEVRSHGRGQFGTQVVHHPAGISNYWTNDSNVKMSRVDSRHLFNENAASLTSKEISLFSPTKSSRNGVIKNFMSTSLQKDSQVGEMSEISPGTIQSSALIFSGPTYGVEQNPLDYVTYIPKPLNNKFTHFGTRMRIIGKIENNESRGQTPIGSSSYYVAGAPDPTKATNIAGSSGGLAIMVDPTTDSGSGYYFEMLALTENNVESYSNNSKIHNIIFYKVGRSSNVPKKLWGGLGKIIVDDGRFTGQARMVAEDNPTVYDLAVEYQNIGNKRRFFLYINSKLVATVDDESPLEIYNNMAVFVRGSARCMFENIYAIANNYSQNTSYALDTPVTSAIMDSEVSVSEAFGRYAMSGIVQSSYLSGISPAEPPKYNMYFEEFGTIMREAAYFNVKYDKAYPALYAKLSPTFNRIRGYTVSGFHAGSYGAEFLVFNATDTVLSLDETSGNYLRIQGITFTQQSEESLTLDDYFNKMSSFSDPVRISDGQVSYPQKYLDQYLDIKASRSNYGLKEFSLSTPYVQTQDDANNLMSWMVSKIMKPRKSLGIRIFADTTIQLGDIVSVSYDDALGVNQVAKPSDRFVVYSIDYSRSAEGPEMTLYLSEVK